MAYNTLLEALIRKVFTAKKIKPSEKKMFGGVAFMLNDKMCCGIVKDDLMLRVTLDQFEDALKQPNAREMDFAGRPMKGFLYVNETGWSNQPELNKWVTLAIEYAYSKEGPKKKKK